MIRQPLKLFLSVFICELVGLLATPFTIASIPTWYAALNKPFFSPPNWIFGPVWTLLYGLMGISLYLIWVQNSKKESKKTALRYFQIQLTLNFFWSFLFFYLRSPEFAFLEIVALLIMIILTIKHFYLLSRPAAYLLIPYLAWVSFASILNLSFALLN